MLYETCSQLSALEPRLAASTMPKQLTSDERDTIKWMLRGGAGAPMDALNVINRARKTKGVDLLNKSTVHWFVKGRTHQHGNKETHGCKKAKKKKNDIDSQPGSQSASQTVGQSASQAPSHPASQLAS